MNPAVQANRRPWTRARPRAAAVLVAVLALAVLVLLSACRVSSSTTSSPSPDASGSSGSGGGQSVTDPLSGLRWVDLATLPSQARRTVALIDAGGPFPYRQDGGVFGNREKILPRQPSGYYREYTVPTPGSKDRGARRIIDGRQGELYWTADHYATFQRIRR